MTNRNDRESDDQIKDGASLPLLPDGWCWTTLETLAKIDGGITKDQNRQQNSTTREVPYLRVANVQRGFLDLDEIKTIVADESDIESLRLLKGDVLFTEGGDRDKLGRGWIWNDEIPECIHQNHIFRARLRSTDISPRFVSYHGNFFGQKWFTRTGKQTTNLASINKGILRQFPVPVAPAKEQLRIIAKIDELFSDLDAGVAALERIRAKLKRYRAAVLKAAVEGKLTAEWRAKHPNVDPASELLKRILAERRRKWEEDQLAKFAKAGKEPPKGWKEKYEEPKAYETNGLTKLPKEWCWASIQQIGSVQLGRQRAPQHHVGPNMRPYLRVANVFEDRIDISDVMEMNFTPDEFETYRLSHGDILLNEGQSMELIGRPAMYRDEVPNACFTNTLVRFRPRNGVDAYYALKVFLAYLKNGRFQKIATITVNIAHLGAGRFSEIEFPLPPIEEQAAIICEVDRHFTSIDAAERSVNLCLVRAARLRQSILKRAFEGKLVAQDAADEPASVLLERIRQQREQSGHAPRLDVEKPARTGKATAAVYDRRNTILTYIVNRHWNTKSFGRTKLEKILHLSQTHVEIPLGFEFERQTAGPFDPIIYKLEGAAAKRGWFTTHKRKNFGVTYEPGPGAPEMAEKAIAYLGDKHAGLDELLDHLAPMDMDQAELLATTYAAWNDLLIDGRAADVDAIIAEVHGWHESKKEKFDDKRIVKCLIWMRQHGYVPTGKGQRTQVAPKAAELPSRRKKRPRTGPR